MFDNALTPLNWNISITYTPIAFELRGYSGRYMTESENPPSSSSSSSSSRRRRHHRRSRRCRCRIYSKVKQIYIYIYVHVECIYMYICAWSERWTWRIPASLCHANIPGNHSTPRRLSALYTSGMTLHSFSLRPVGAKCAPYPLSITKIPLSLTHTDRLVSPFHLHLHRIRRSYYYWSYHKVFFLFFFFILHISICIYIYSRHRLHKTLYQVLLSLMTEIYRYRDLCIDIYIAG